MIRLLLPMLLACAAAVPDSASALEAKKPSQLVTLEANELCDLNRGQIYDARVLPDGSTAPFAIPQGQVLVVTRWMFRFGGGTPGNAAFAYLRIEGSAAGIGQGPFVYDAQGRGVGSFELSAVVGAGTQLCGTNSDLAGGVSLGGFLEGYLTKAR